MKYPDDNPEDAQAHNWPRFTAFCEAEGISLDHEDDWLPWWSCWCAGYQASELKYNPPSR